MFSRRQTLSQHEKVTRIGYLVQLPIQQPSNPYNELQVHTTNSASLSTSKPALIIVATLYQLQCK